MDMEVIYTISSDDKIQFIEAIKIINKLTDTQINFYHSYTDDENKKSGKFNIQLFNHL